MLKRLGIPLLCIVAALSGCSSNGKNVGSDALAEVRAACGIVGQLDPTAVQYDSKSQQAFFNVERDADGAAGKDPQWRVFADDVRAYLAALAQDRAGGTGGAFYYSDNSSAAWNRIANDCKAVGTGS